MLEIIVFISGFACGIIFRRFQESHEATLSQPENRSNDSDDFHDERNQS